MSDINLDFWKKCSSCKKPLAWGSQYYVCSVSTCNGQRTGYVFCGMPCFEVHLPGARHRDAGGIKKTAPLKSDSQNQQTQPDAGPRKIIPTGQRIIPSQPAVTKPKEILIVASKLKDYISQKADMNTSAAVMDVLSDIVRRACDDAIDQARIEGRKTVLDRDFKK
jgi:hypothetical protein